MLDLNWHKRCKRREDVWVLWLRPIIPATWEAEIGRTVVQDQLQQKVSETPSHSRSVVGGMYL
jgi:hypothetical protein